MQDIIIKLANVKERIEQKIRHPYLLKYIQSPVIDEDKLLLLLSILEKAGIQDEHKSDNYAITTMLIQIALDTHELVSNNNLEIGQIKERQLTVLSGVYYSGLYYKILAELEEIDIIRILAEGIKEVNEHKITMYQRDNKDIEELMNGVKKIEASLFEKITLYFHNTQWSEFAADLLFIKRLAVEKQQLIHGRTTIFLKALIKTAIRNTEYLDKALSAEQQKYLLRICDQYIERSKQCILMYMDKLPYMNELLEQRIQMMISEHGDAANTFVEEG